MLETIVFAGAMLASPPLQSPELPPEMLVAAAANDFFTALGDEDRTKLAEVMIPEATIFVHDRMDPDNARLVIIPVEDHIARWAQGTGNVSEDMIYSTILVDGDMAQVWGPYRFMVEGETSHCGINSLSMVKTEDGWKVGNTSFTMVPPNECERLAAPEAPGLG